MDFCVVHFEYDSQITVVSATKIKVDDEMNLQAELQCLAPFETESIGDDGREIVINQDYKGTVICTGQVKKKASDIARKCQKQLEDGEQPKMSENEDPKPKKTKEKSATFNIVTKKKKKADETKSKTKASSKDKVLRLSQTQEKKKHISAEKMAEMLELLGGDSPDKIGQTSPTLSQAS
ncbi:uncharacterized protein LOC134232329 [Saccostrea cucullata]|uniref:uncharacterized protein LOC134232329 n=1 Tax=Saccostrea cuccullata TaxID=36930 RepID=UPI002ED1432F